MPISNFQPIRLLDPCCWYKFTNLMTNRADPDQLIGCADPDQLTWSTDLDLHCLQRQDISGIRVRKHQIVIHCPSCVCQICKPQLSSASLAGSVGILRVGRLIRRLQVWSPPGHKHYFVETYHEIFSTVIDSLFRWFKKTVVSFWRMCTILVNCLED